MPSIPEALEAIVAAHRDEIAIVKARAARAEQEAARLRGVICEVLLVLSKAVE